MGEITSTSVDSIRNALSKGSYPIPSFKIGRKRVFRLVDVAAYLDHQFSDANGNSSNASFRHASELVQDVPPVPRRSAK